MDCMKTITLIIPVSEAEQLLDKLPIAQYPRTVVALLGSQELATLTPRMTAAQAKIIEADRALACNCDVCTA